MPPYLRHPLPVNAVWRVDHVMDPQLLLDFSVVMGCSTMFRALMDEAGDFFMRINSAAVS